MIAFRPGYEPGLTQADMAETDLDRETFLLKEHNCALCDVAAEFQAACNSQLGFLRAVFPDAEVAREDHLLSGGLSCTYRIRRRVSAGA